MDFNFTLDFATYSKWSAIATLVFLLLTIIAFIFQWGLRFRLVGVTGFMMVVTTGLFGLGLGLFTRTVIPGAIRYSLVYDNGANQAVIAVPPEVSISEIEATLKQAANDLYSYGRLGLGDNKLNIRARTILHPQEGLSIPLYLGEVKRSLTQREDEEMKINIYSENFAQLPQ